MPERCLSSAKTLSWEKGPLVTNMLFPAEYSPDQSWVDQDCDIRESVYGWDRAPCSACTISNIVTKNIEVSLNSKKPKFTESEIEYYEKCLHG